MNMWKQGNVATSQSQSMAVDAGLREYMLSVYNYMGAGLAITGIVALMASQSEALMQLIFGTPLKWVVMFAPLGAVMFLSFKIQSMSFKAAQISFWAFAGLMGLSLSSIFLMYTGVSIVRVFFITSITFGAMSLYGYTTKRDLSGFGSFLMMGVIGIIIASVVNIFLQSTMLHFITSAIGVLLFVGLTAYDTQRIKNTYHALKNSGEFMGKAAVMGALSLYLDFINLFIMLLQFFGDRR